MQRQAQGKCHVTYRGGESGAMTEAGRETGPGSPLNPQEVEPVPYESLT